MKLMTSLKFFAVWAKKKAGGSGWLCKKNLIHLPKAQNDFIRAINLKPHMRDLSDYDTNKILTQFSLM